MLEIRQRLPAYEMKEEIVELVMNNQVVVLTGETGEGEPRTGWYILLCKNSIVFFTALLQVKIYSVNPDASS